MALDLPRLRVAARMYAIWQAAGGNKKYAIRQAADGNQDALAYILRRFIGDAKQGRAVGPETARVVADVLEPALAGENIGKLLGTQARRGRPRKYKNAILVHAVVRFFMRLRSKDVNIRRQQWENGLRPGRTQRRGDDAQAATAEALGMSLNTVQKNYKQVQKLIKTIKANPFLDLERSGLAPEEELYLRDRGKYFFLLNIAKQLRLDEELYLRDPQKYFFCGTSSNNFYWVNISLFLC